MFVCQHNLYTLVLPIAADCTDIREPVIACYPTFFTRAAPCKFTLLVHRVEIFLVMLLLRGHITLAFALAGQLSGHEHLRWRQFGICRLLAHGMQGCVHITGGGFTENLPRVMPKGLACQVQTSSWEWPPLFQWLQQASKHDLRVGSAGVKSSSKLKAMHRASLCMADASPLLGVSCILLHHVLQNQPQICATLASRGLQLYVSAGLELCRLETLRRPRCTEHSTWVLAWWSFFQNQMWKRLWPLMAQALSWEQL